MIAEAMNFTGEVVVSFFAEFSMYVYVCMDVWMYLCDIVVTFYTVFQKTWCRTFGNNFINC